MSKTDGAATAADSTTTTSSAGAAPAAATAKAVPLTGKALGIDVGGTGTKAAMIDLASAELVTARYREKTPQPSEPEAVIEVIETIVGQVLEEHGPIDDLAVGCGLPGPIKYGRMKMAANLDKGWVDFDATGVLSEKLGRPVHVINDADAAGMAELAYGEARDRDGTTILLTIGTGIGSALISEGRLVPNTEFGHLEMHGQAAETLVSGVARERRELKWKPWATEFNEYLAMLDFYFCARVVRSEGDQTAFSYTAEPFFEERFMKFLRAYHSVHQLTKDELLFLKEAYRFFILNYVLRVGEHFFQPELCHRLQQEAVEEYLPHLELVDFEPLLEVL